MACRGETEAVPTECPLSPAPSIRAPAEGMPSPTGFLKTHPALRSLNGWVCPLLTMYSLALAFAPGEDRTEKVADTTARRSTPIFWKGDVL